MKDCVQLLLVTYHLRNNCWSNSAIIRSRSKLKSYNFMHLFNYCLSPSSFIYRYKYRHKYLMRTNQYITQRNHWISKIIYYAPSCKGWLPFFCYVFFSFLLLSKTFFFDMSVSFFVVIASKTLDTDVVNCKHKVES